MCRIFLWDYDISEPRVRDILRTGTEVEKEWLITRIMTKARFEDIWKYLKVKEIVRYFPKLRMRPREKVSWQRALSVWGYAV